MYLITSVDGVKPDKIDYVCFISIPLLWIVLLSAAHMTGMSGVCSSACRVTVKHTSNKAAKAWPPKTLCDIKYFLIYHNLVYFSNLRRTKMSLSLRVNYPPLSECGLRSCRYEVDVKNRPNWLFGHDSNFHP